MFYHLMDISLGQIILAGKGKTGMGERDGKGSLEETLVEITPMHLSRIVDKEKLF